MTCSALFSKQRGKRAIGKATTVSEGEAPGVIKVTPPTDLAGYQKVASENEGYQQGWYTDTSFASDKKVDVSDIGTAELTGNKLYTKYEAINYTIALNAGDKGSVDTTGLDLTASLEDTEFALPDAVSTDSTEYDFAGWFTDATAGEQVTATEGKGTLFLADLSHKITPGEGVFSFAQKKIKCKKITFVIEFFL